MRVFETGLAVAVVGVLLAGQTSSPPRAFDPVGKWALSTTSDEGVPMTVAIEIKGTPGAYKGEAVTSNGTTLRLLDVATSQAAMIALFELRQGAIVVRIADDGTGKLVGAWGSTPQIVPLTATRAK